ncbi:MAG TPA: SDR family NAD(P)-dependent oxidoreductase [Solirubrobacterales bacterium]|nr:SDR family NAD(P)-dependent oxidoreductase [Solirubrobacterales bacterium]
MRVLVTGASGLVGSHTVRALLDDGHEVRASARSAERVARALDPLGCADAVEVVEADVTDPEAVARALDACDAVVHAAATFSYDIRDGREMLATNARAAEVVLGAACERGLDPVIHVSSFVVFLPAQGTITPDSPIGRSKLAYTASKARSEEVARRLQSEGFPVTTTYPGAVWGPNDPALGETSRLALDVLAGKLPLGAPGLLPVVDVRDLARVHARALRPGLGPRRYLAVAELVPMLDVMRIISEAGGRRSPRGRVPGPVMLGLTRFVDVIQRLVPTRLPLNHEGVWVILNARPFDVGGTVRDLEVEFRPAAETLRDTVAWLRETAGDRDREPVRA